MSVPNSAIPRHALVALLVRAERALAAGDDAQAERLLEDLHWFAQRDAQLHEAVHRYETDLARRRGDRVASLRQLLPSLFARATSVLESFAPAYEVVKDIPASPEEVYRVIADVESYAEWNPWVVEGEGTAAKVGDEVVVKARLGSQTMKVGHRVLVAEPGERFGWCDLGWFTPLASGRRLRWLERVGEGTRLVSQIQLYGPFAHLAWRLHGSAIRNGMAAEAEALTVRVSSRREPEVSMRVPKRTAREDKPFHGKTCVVTGPTHGIGRPTAMALGELGARVLLVCRNAEKGAEVARELAARGAEGVVVQADLASLQEASAAAARIRELAPQLDVLVNNAAVLNHERRVTKDGFEEGFGVNFLAHFLLTNRLLPSLEAAPAARVVHVSSNTHPVVGRFDFTDWNWERRPFVSIPAYAHTKLAILLFNRALARRLNGSRVRSNALHPGVIATGMGTSHPTFGKFINPIVRPIFLTPEQGAMTSIYVATSPDIERHQGAYFADSRLAKPGRWAQDDVAAERLYGLATSLLADRGHVAVGRAA